MKSPFLARQVQKLPRQTRAILLTSIFGLSAGVVTVAFQSAITWMTNQTYGEFARSSTRIFLIGTFLTIICSSLLVGFLLSSFCREASGSGIPQLKLSFWKDFGFVRWRVVWVKFLAGILSIGGGCSLGREGPSVHFAGGLASQLAGLLGEAKQNRRLAAAAGAAAGLAAAFNTPLASVTFVLEEIIEDLNSALLGSVLLASVLGAFVVHGLIGKQPAFSLTGVEAPTWKSYLFTPVVAVVASLVGLAFQKFTMDLRTTRKRFRHVPIWVRPAIGGFITWVLGSAVFLSTGHLGVFGLGYDDLSAALSNHLGWKLAGVLVLAKLIATFSCYGFGGSGGIFSPTLFLGGMSGVFLAGLAGLVLHLPAGDNITLAVVGMSACLGAVVRAPVTGILIVFEMTHEFSLVPALMIGALISQAVSRRLLKHNFYEEILVQDGHNLEHVIPPRDLQSWHQLPVSAVASFQPVLIESLDPAIVRKTLASYPYERFPVVQDGKLIGILFRKEAEAALQEGRPPKLLSATTCLRTQSIRELQKLLIESPTFVTIVLDQPEGKVLGLVTLHDLLRAEVSFAQQSAA